MIYNPKKIMLLGGIRYLLPVIEAAHKHGYYVITADYLPDNIAHKYSDEYVNVSIIDKEAVLKVAQEKQIDGIMSFGVDPGVVTAAYVAEKMGLPNVGPYESVEILQNKDKFRAFLAEHNFNVPKAQGFDNIGEALQCEWIIQSLSPQGKEGKGLSPLIVKPTDSAGSKGVTRVDSLVEYESALKHAFECSHSHHVIVEQFIEKEGCSSDTDSFLLNGKWAFVSFNAQRFDASAANPYAPAAYTWPSTFPEYEEDLTNELQRLVSLLHMQTAVYNIETRVGTDGKPYIMECTPRGGGNRLCEMLRYATGVDMIDAMVQYAVGESMSNQQLSISKCKSPQAIYTGHWAEVILHADKDGVFDSLEIANTLPAEVVERDLWVEKGDRVEAFNGANNAIGTLVLRFADKEQMEYAVTHQNEWLKVVVK